MQRMTEDLFEYTKVKQVDTKLAINRINVVRMVEQITVEFELEANKAGREFQIVAEPDDNILVDIDPEKFVRIFSNLFTISFIPLVINTNKLVKLLVVFLEKVLQENPCAVRHTAIRRSNRFIRKWPFKMI